MTSVGADFSWQCPMCFDSWTVMPAVVMAAGEQYSNQMVERFKSDHIDWHCEAFADELEYAC